MIMLSILADGGLIFMLPILILCLLILILVVKAFIAPDSRSKSVQLIASLGLFTLVWGLLGQSLSMVQAFDAIEMADDASIGMLAAQLKVTFLPAVFGLLAFLIARLGIILVNLKATD